ncbi:MAG TPA: neutral zinc metallopeptidase [Thermopolyspora sp.]
MAIVGILGGLAAIFVLLVVGTTLLTTKEPLEPVSPLSIPTFTPPTTLPTYRTSTTNADRETTRPSPAVTRSHTAPVLNRSLKDNTLYKMGRLPSTRCPAGSASIYSHRQLKALILKTSKCLNREWSAGLERLGIDFAPPHYAIVAGRGRGACGDYPQRGSIVPYYCPRTMTIYASTTAMAKGSGNAIGYGQLASWHGAIISMMAHEYGHHVQNLTGVSDSWWRRTLDSGSQSARLALSRRLELQATCFGGMFMRSVAASYPVTPANRATLTYFYSHVGDWPGYPRDHGSPVNNNRWFHRGFDNNVANRCNTWRASTSSVS